MSPVQPYFTNSSIPASLVYNQAKVVQITPASPHPKFTDQRPGPGVFRICGRDDQQGAVAGAFIASRFADRNVAVIDDKSAYGKGRVFYTAFGHKPAELSKPEIRTILRRGMLWAAR